MPFSWQEEQRSAFTELKHRLVSAPILAYPNFSLGAGSFILDTDASQQLGNGAILSQLQADGTKRLIGYGSRSLNKQEKNYCTTRLEMLALVTYVVLVWTDHHYLRWLMPFKEPQRQGARWLERLQDYDYETTWQ